MGYELILAEKIIQTVFYGLIGLAALDALIILYLTDRKKKNESNNV